MTMSISVRIPEELAHKLDDVARETECTRSFIIQKALESYIEEHADFQIALDRLNDRTDPVISSDQMRERLGI